MSVATLTTPLPSRPVPAPRKFTLIPRLDQDAKVVAQAQTLAGKVAIIALAALLLAWRNPRPTVFLIVVALVTLLPAFRRIVLTVASVFWIFISGLLKQDLMVDLARAAGLDVSHPALWVASGIACVSLIFGLGWLGLRKQRSLIVGRRPVLSLAILFCALLAVAGTAAVPPGLRFVTWILVAPLSGFLWILAYALRDCQRDPGAVQGIGSMLATLWSRGASSIPMLKGPAHARKVEAFDPREFAIVQLKGVKLLMWTIVLVLCSAAIQYVLLKFDIPTLEEAMDRNLNGGIPVWLCWASLTGSFVLLVITLTIWGHSIVGGLRLLGFKALRNTYAPFRARTIAEFWNRIYFYFKELLVDHFYYPAYLRYFKRSPRVRTVFATFAAACFGNAFYHFVRDVDEVARLGLWRALAGFQVYMFYTVVLATGISISQLRGKRRQRSWFRSEVVSRVSIVAFYCLIHIFDDTRRTVSLGAHFAFLFRLFGA
jgi:hypothetical protein